MSPSWTLFWLRIVVAAILTPAVKWIGSLAGFGVPWWLAAAIALVFVFGGWLIIVNADEVAR